MSSSSGPRKNSFTAHPAAPDDVVHTRQQAATAASLTAIPQGAVARGTRDLVLSRFNLGENPRPDVARAFSLQSGSAIHDQRVKATGSQLLTNMMQNAVAGRALDDKRSAAHAKAWTGIPEKERDPFKKRPVNDLSPLGGQLKPSQLKVEVQMGTAPHFNPATTAVSLMNPGMLDQTAHETQHAFDHLHGDVDLKDNRQKIASELNAFTQQHAVSMQVSGQPPSIFRSDSGHQRSPVEMARSYEGKEGKGYEGTLTSSLEAARAHASNKFDLKSSIADKKPAQRWEQNADTWVKKP